jgi:hypothetical protein
VRIIVVTSFQKPMRALRYGDYYYYLTVGLNAPWHWPQKPARATIGAQQPAEDAPLHVRDRDPRHSLCECLPYWCATIHQIGNRDVCALTLFVIAAGCGRISYGLGPRPQQGFPICTTDISSAYHHIDGQIRSPLPRFRLF